jgi:Gpi18-like mannosyltransferase
MDFNKYSRHFVLLLVTAALSISIWFAFYFHLPTRIGFPDTSLETVFANYDGPNYMVIAKCGYQKSCIASKFSLPQPLEYYPAHFPGYPLLIRYFSLYLTTPKAMLLSTFLGSLFITLVTFVFFKQYLNPKTAFWLTLVSIFFPARMMVLRLVGAPETWFIGLILLSLILYRRQQYWLSAVAAALSVLFKSPGILLFAVYGIMALKNRSLIKHLPYLLLPLTAIAIFYFYYLETGDFFAYFHSGDNIHLNALPYLVFISNHTWINTIWLEDVIYIYLIAFYGVYRLFKKYKLNEITLFASIYTLAAVFVAHRDISRYIAPVYPFLFLAYYRLLNRKSFRVILLLLAPALILFAVNFLVGNTAPIADWTPYL